MANDCHGEDGRFCEGGGSSGGSGGASDPKEIALTWNTANERAAPFSGIDIGEESARNALGISRLQHHAVFNYSWDTYYKANSQLRRGEYPETEAQIKKIDAAIDKSVLPEDCVVYRGLGSDAGDALIKSGGCSDKGFQSTSLDLAKAVTFSRGEKGCVMVMQLSKGDHAVYNNARNEHEMLLPRGTSWVVDHAEEVRISRDGKDFPVHRMIYCRRA